MQKPGRGIPLILLALLSAGDAHTTEPCLVGSNRLGPAIASTTAAGITYLAAGSSLLALEVSNPASPILLSRFDLDFEPREIASTSGLVALAAGEAGLVLVDSADPKSLRVSGRLDFDGLAVALVLQPPLALVAVNGGLDAIGALLVVDISEPEAPEILGTLELGTSGNIDVTAWNHYAFFSGSGIAVIDYADPAHPKQVGSFFRGGWEMLVSPTGRRLYSLTQTNPPQDSFALDVIDVSDPAAPTLVGTIPAFPDSFEGLAVDTTHLFTVDPAQGLLVFDVGNETALPTLVGVLSGRTSTSDLFRTGSRILSSEGRHGLAVIDVSKPQVPVELGRYPTQSASHGVRAAGSIAYVRTEAGIRTLDLISPAVPIDLGFFPTESVGGYGDAPGDFVVEGGVAFVPDASGVRVLDVTSASNPTEISTWKSPSPARTVALSGTTLYVGLQTPLFEDEPALYVIDVSDPADPVEVGALEDDGFWPEKLTVEGDLLLATDVFRTGECWVYDIAQRHAPVVLASCDVGPRTADMTVRDNLLFQSGASRLTIIDISTPAAPTLVGSLALLEPTLWGVAVDGERAYLAHQEKGLELVDVADPSSPARRVTLDTPGQALDIAVRSGLLLVADGAAGLSVFSDCVLFADGVESGDLSGWSVLLP